ncbi:aminodeoxychorismate/anthranilate synthase component II, partial [Campylobacter sp. FMV-PI01]
PTHIILSPGPKHPKDSEICLEIIEADLNVPILGICLGHQAIAYKFGASIKTLKTPVHGKSSKISVINEGDIFKNLPSNFEVMRYHSLYVDNLPNELEILAKSDVIMAIKHKTKQIYGIQFHPESFFTQYGKKIIENFINLNQISKNKEKNVENFAPFMKKLQVGYPLDSSDYEIICKAINNIA